MSPAAEALYNSAMTLPAAERRELAEELLEVTIDEPPCPESRGEVYLKEIQRRTRETNPATWLQAEDMIRRVNAKHGIMDNENA